MLESKRRIRIILIILENVEVIIISLSVMYLYLQTLVQSDRSQYRIAYPMDKCFWLIIFRHGFLSDNYVYDIATVIFFDIFECHYNTCILQTYRLFRCQTSKTFLLDLKRDMRIKLKNNKIHF